MTEHAAQLPEIDRVRLDEAVARLGLRLVVLYGSHARGRPPPGPDSDVDVAVLGCPARRLLDCYQALAPAFPGAPIDLVRLEEADPLFRQEIMSAGVRLAGDLDLFCDYRSYAYRDYVDSADLRALERALFQKKMGRLRGLLDAEA